MLGYKQEKNKNIGIICDETQVFCVTGSHESTQA